jgi:hypothetical protein
MANILSKNNILTGEQVEAWNITQSIDAFTKAAAYDITLSGSFTLTGSFKVDGDVLGSTNRTSSTSISSSYTLYTPSADSSSYATKNLTDSLTLQFYHYPADTLSNTTSYRITMGEPPTATSARGGITLPIDCTIRAAFISVSSNTIGSNQLSTLSMLSGSTTLYTFTGRPSYNQKFTSFNESIGLSYSAGTSIAFGLTTPTWTTAPLGVTHNITLYIYPT